LPDYLPKVRASHPGEIAMPYEYAAKILCGLNKKDGMIAHGIYETVVNVHNPYVEGQQFKYKVALAGNPADGKISTFTTTKIGADGAQFYGCNEFHKITATAPTAVIDGFFVIQSPQPLDVIAVYTTNDVNGAGVPAIAVERVFERKS
jgi:hypothetical protein